MSVYKPGKSRFYHYDFVIEGRRFHGSTGQVREVDARRYETKIRREIADGRHGDASDVTLDVAAGRWWDDVGCRRGDARDVERRVEVLLSLLGKNTRVADIGADAVARAIRKRKEVTFSRSAAGDARRYAPSDSTVNRDVIDTLRPVLAHADMLWGSHGLRVHLIPWGRLRLREPSGVVKVFSPEEQRAWYSQCDPTTAFALQMLLTYGLRFGELFFGLDDFDDTGPRLHIRRRLRNDGTYAVGRKRDVGGHLLPLRHDHAREIMARLGRARSAGLQHIWFTEVHSKDGDVSQTSLEPLTYWGLQARLDGAAERAGVSKGRRIHGLRHHAATEALRRTGSRDAARELLRLTNDRTTARYAHYLEDQLRTVIEVDGPIEAALRKASS